MKKSAFYFTTAFLVFSLLGCAGREPEESSEAGEKTETIVRENSADTASGTAGTEENDRAGQTGEQTEVQSKGIDDGAGNEELSWHYELTKQKIEDQVSADDGTVLARINYEYPSLEVLCDTEGKSAEAPQEMQKICDRFNEKIHAFTGQFDTAAQLAEDAKIQYRAIDEEYRKNFPTYYEGLEISDIYQTENLYEIQMFYEVYMGGAHGMHVITNFHFDTQKGDFFELNDLSDQKEDLHNAIVVSILNNIYEAGNSEWYFENYVEAIQNKTDYNVSFQEDGLHIIFEEYEIAPYVAGMPEFTVPYFEISSYLSQEGKDLLNISKEDQILGEFLEAQDQLFWFDGAAPMDYDDQQQMTFYWIDGSSWEEQLCRLDYPGVTDMNSLKALFARRFTDRVVDELFADAGKDQFLFQELNGVVYVRTAGRGSDITVGGVDYEVELNTAQTGGKVIATIRRLEYDFTAEDYVYSGENDVMEFPFELDEYGARFDSPEQIY